MIKWREGRFNTTEAMVGPFRLTTLWSSDGHIFEISGVARSEKKFDSHGKAQKACAESLEGILKDALKIVRT